MKQKVMRIVCLTMVLVLSLSFTAYANDDHYNLGETMYRLNGGIGSVTCSNRVDRDLYPVLYNAVEVGIRDWDWHLGLLNTEFGVNWNMFSVGTAKEDAIITFRTTEETLDITTCATGYIYCFEDSEQERTMWNFNEPEDSNWDNGIVWIYLPVLRSAGLLQDAEQLRSMVNHEVGHILGLEHYNDDGVLMYDSQDRETSVPTRADLMGVYELYKNS